MTPNRPPSRFLTSIGLAGSTLSLLSMVACQKTAPATQATVLSSSAASSFFSSARSVKIDVADVDTQHMLLASPYTSKTYSLSATLAASGQTIVLQDATFPKSPALLTGMQHVLTTPGSMDYRSHTLFVVRRLQNDAGEYDELWAYTKDGGKRLMLGRDIRFSVSPQATMVAVANANALQIIDVRNGTLMRTFSSSDLPAELVAKKERYFGKPTQLMPWAWSDDSTILWFSADGSRPYAFAKLTLNDSKVETFELKKDFTATDTALNANTGIMALSDASAANTTNMVTLSALNLMTNELKPVLTATGGALHPQWLNDDTLFIVKNGKKMPISLQ